MIIKKEHDCEYVVYINDEKFKITTTDDNQIVVIDGISRHTTDKLIKQIQTKIYEYQ